MIFINTIDDKFRFVKLSLLNTQAAGQCDAKIRSYLTQREFEKDYLQEKIGLETLPLNHDNYHVDY